MKTKTNTMSVDDIRNATTELGALRNRMTFVMPLTAAERRVHRSARIGLKRLRMVENRVVAARQNRELLPPAFDLRKFERDAELTGALGECLTAIDEIRQAVRDTLLAVANRTVVAAATAYAHIKVASNSADRLKRTVEKLGARGSRSTAKGTEPAEVPKPADAAQTAAPADSTPAPADKAA